MWKVGMIICAALVFAACGTEEGPNEPEANTINTEQLKQDQQDIMNEQMGERSKDKQNEKDKGMPGNHDDIDTNNEDKIHEGGYRIEGK